MPRNLEVSSNERLYHVESLKRGSRINRDLRQKELSWIREPSVRVPESENGYVEIDWGQTKISVRVTLHTEKTEEESRSGGVFRVKCHIGQMALMRFENHKKSTEESLYVQQLEQLVRGNRIIDWNSLDNAGENSIWNITASITCLNYDGNFLDPACLGMLIALGTYRCQNRDGTVLRLLTRGLRSIPVFLTYLFLNITSLEENLIDSVLHTIFFLDADQTEEQIRDGSVVFGMNENNEMCLLFKSGSLPIEFNSLMDLVKSTQNVVEMLNLKIREELKKRFDHRGITTKKN